MSPSPTRPPPLPFLRRLHDQHRMPLGADWTYPRHESPRGADPHRSQARQVRGQVEQILKACWEVTIETRPYDFGERIDWSKVLQGGRFCALMQIGTTRIGLAFEKGFFLSDKSRRNVAPNSSSLTSISSAGAKSSSNSAGGSTAVAGSR